MKSLTYEPVRAKRLETPEDYEAMVAVYQKAQGLEDVTPVYTTHAILVNGKISGGFCLQSPSVYWWMDPEVNSIRNSMSALGCLESLMLESGVQGYLIVCEDTSEYHRLLEPRLKKVEGENGSTTFNVFLRNM